MIFDSGWHFPLAYGLLPGKSQALYSSLLVNLDSFGPYDPQSVLCDYEFALHNAIAQTWPSDIAEGRRGGTMDFTPYSPAPILQSGSFYPV